MKKSKFTVLVEKKLIQAAPKKTKAKFSSEYFIKGKGTTRAEACSLKFLNLTMPQVKEHLSRLMSLTNLTFNEMQSLWFESDIFEVRSLAAYWLDRQDLDFLMKNHKKVLAWAKSVDNWAHADQLCSIYARMFEKSQALILPTYLKWNRHQSPWLRRCSMVGTFYYSRQRSKQPSFALVKRLIDPHLMAPEYYVQKAVGWTIREMYNSYPYETTEYIENNLYKINSVAWVASAEKLSVKSKRVLLKKRRFNRLRQH